VIDIVERARIFATAAHAAVRQLRKYSNEPYIYHPAAVVKLVASVPHTPEMLAAAWLHDVIEDTGVEFDTLRFEFGDEVAELVAWLTDEPRESGNRTMRKAMDCDRLAHSPKTAQTIKLADLIDNTLTIEERDPDFAVVYRKEKAALLEVLTKGDAALMKMAKEQLHDNSTGTQT
jgi:(p)ppGpp synthase/HD superfamily hydrolase